MSIKGRLQVNFKGYVPSSKSLVNRYLILKEGFPGLSLEWESKAKDVSYLKEALEKYKTTHSIYIGEGGTTLRFLAVFLSSQKGSWTLEGTESLFKRPHEELIEVLESLGANAFIKGNKLLIESEGWKVEEIKVHALKTTQVLTGLVLAALSSKQSLRIMIGNKGVNSDYFKLTERFVKSLGFDVLFTPDEVFVNKEQAVNSEITSHRLESDWSSAAFIYVMASIMGKASLKGLELESVQPDVEILNILKTSGVCVNGFTVEKPVHKEVKYLPVNENLQRCPDLFPVLSVFACFCEGGSTLYGAPQLIYKESNRIELIKDLLEKCGYKVEKKQDGISIQGEGFKILEHEEFSFDASSDHRIFMACEILKKVGYKIDIKGADSINKSFPEYHEMGVC